MIRVEQVGRPEWDKLAQNAHLISFGEIRPPEFNRFHYALVCLDDAEIYSYATIVEMDQESAYMQHGGAMPNIKGTVSVLKCYRLVMDWLRLRYKRISTRISNQNLPMLKMAMHEGLRIIGCDLYPDGVFLHLNLEVL